MPEKDNEREEKTPSDAAFAFLVTVVAGMLMPLLRVRWWSRRTSGSPSAQRLSGIVSGHWRASA